MAIYPVLSVLNPGTTGTQLYGQEQIQIFDSDTGLPANGNNIAVTYQQNINGSVSTATVKIRRAS
mgnify:FL=1